jgi:hypothetical protein
MASPDNLKVRKNMDMDAAKLATAQKVLGTRTETETIDEALNLVLFQHEVAGAISRLAELGGVDDVYGRSDARRVKAVAERPRKA